MGLVQKNFQFWPPPDRSSWQYKIFFMLFRLMFFSLAALCVVSYHRDGVPPSSLLAVGWLLFILGFGLACLITIRLGWKNAHGVAVALKTDGWFAVSRNPIYVVSIIGMIGLAIAINSIYVTGLLLLWAAMYILAPFAEEPWLAKKYGNSYREYYNRVPRFLGRIRNP